MAKYKANMSKEEFDDYMIALKENGHSMKSGDVPGSVYTCSRVYYGGWKQALTALNITQERHKTSQELSPTFEEASKRFSELIPLCKNKTDINEKDPSLYRYIRKWHGSIEAFALKVGINLNDYGIIKKPTFRIVNNDKQEIVNEDITLNKFETSLFLRYILETSLYTKIDDKYLLKNYPREYSAIRCHFKSLADATTSFDDIYVLDKQVPKKWSSEFLIKQIKLGIALNKPLNCDYVTKNASSAEEFARKKFGSWGEAMEVAGVDYDRMLEATQVYTFYGNQFEGVFGELLTDLGVRFTSPKSGSLRPDFIVGDEWIDAKLSYTTVFSKGCRTIEKYEPHCNSLTIVYLRGKTADKKISEKTTIRHVDYYINLLPEEKRDRYVSKFVEIENKLNAGEIGSQSA